MAFLRALIVSILAAISGCAIVSLITSGNIERASFFPLIFALPGSLLLLATGYGALAEQGRPLILRYAALLAIGIVGGGAMLGFISHNGASIVIGSLYGFATAVCWVVLHALSRFLSTFRR